MVDLPGIFYYHDLKHAITAPNTFTVSVASKTTAHPFYNYGSGNGYYITGDKYGSVTESPALSMSRGTTYTFNQNDSTNTTHAIYFSTNEDAYGGTLRYEVGVPTLSMMKSYHGRNIILSLLQQQLVVFLLPLL